MPIDVNTLPRTAVQQWLKAVRVPLNAYASITKRADNETWPPALAFDAFEAQVKGFAGTIFHDEKLRESSALGRERISRLRDAEALEAAADQKREQADREVTERRQAAEQRASDARENADDKKQQLEAREADAKRQVREQAAAEKKSLDDAAQDTQELIDERARVARQKQLKAERDALAERKKAVSAKSRALNLDDAKQATRQRRKANS